jgi:glycerol-3-phosphate cytidylyltransferase
MGLVIYTGGTFDLFHAGHAAFLKRCKEMAQYGRVVVSLNTDEFIADYKGKSPVMSFAERKAVLESCKYVDDVVANVGGVDSRIAIETVKPDIIVIGSDWARKNYYDQMNFTQSWLDERGIVLAYVPYTTGISSTEIKERIKGW